MPDLIFKSTFPETLKTEAESILGADLKLGKRFKSSDSFSYLLEGTLEKYVGKIFRFKDWPPEGKVDYIHKMLDKNHIPHEEIVYSSFKHSEFINGWQLSKYIAGATARSLRDDKLLDNKKYLSSLGNVLKQIHEIKFDYYGSLDKPQNRFPTFLEFAEDEMAKQDFNSLPSDYLWALRIIDRAKSEVLDNLSRFKWENPTLVHDDVNDRNVIMQNEKLILIDWVDSFAGPPLRDFATLTFRNDESVLSAIEAGYGKTIDQDELRLHQMMRIIRLGWFFYFEDKDIDEFQIMIERLKLLLNQDKPYGA